MKSIVICPECNIRHFQTYDSRKIDNEIIMRRKRCMNCGYKIVIYEIDGTDYDKMIMIPNKLSMLKDAARQILEL